MMKHLIILAVSVLMTFGTASAQSVTISKKSVTYTRTSPAAEFRKTFVVEYPKVRAANAALAKRIEKSLGYGVNNLFDLEGEVSGEYPWLDNAGFDVSYNKRGVLCVWLFVEGTSAYPTSLSKYVVIDLRTGRRVAPEDVFVDIPGLARAVKEIQDADVKSSIEEIKKETDYGVDDPARLFEYVDFKAIHLEGFSVNDDGVTFSYDYGFPRILAPIEPAGAYFMRWKEIKPFVNRRGLLGRFATRTRAPIQRSKIKMPNVSDRI